MVQYQTGARESSLPQACRLALGAHSASYWTGDRGSSPGQSSQDTKLTTHFPSSVKVKNEWSHNSIPPHSFIVWTGTSLPLLYTVCLGRFTWYQMQAATNNTATTCRLWLRCDYKSPHVHNCPFVCSFQYNNVEWFLKHCRLLEIDHGTQLCLHKAKITLPAHIMQTTIFLLCSFSGN